MIIPVILAGGVGIRLWPLSRGNHPKQFLSIMDDETLFQSTLNRLKGFPNLDTPIVIGNYHHRYVLAEQVWQLNRKVSFLMEEKIRNTAASVILSALYAIETKQDPLLLFLPSDQWIEDSNLFQKTIQQAVPTAQEGNIILFGIKPTEPNTQYGYIKRGKISHDHLGYKVESFSEKPELEKAKSFVESGDYYWNSGMFLCKASVLIHEISQYAPQLIPIAQNALRQSLEDRYSTHSEFIIFKEKFMEEFPSLPIDKLLLEKTKHGVIFPFLGRWEDVGDWQAYYRLSKKDENGNVINQNVVTFNTTNSFFHTEKQLIVTSGIEDIMLVATPDVIYVAPMNKKQDIKKIINTLLENNYKEEILFSK